MADENQGGEATVESLRADKERLTEQLAQIVVFLTSHDDFQLGESEVEAPADAVTRFIEGIQAENRMIYERIGALEAENAELRATLTATKGHATRAKNEAAVLRAELSPVARKVGRPRGLFGKDAEPYSPELAAIAIGEMDNVEIVFSDGKAEIVALAPVTAWPQAWLPRGGRHMLREPVELEGGDAEAEVAGVALVSAGEQIGWCEFPEPVRLPKYGRVRLENCITF